MHESPFKFLDAYTKEDRDIFFGRDNEIEELYQRVFESKTLLICGVSGTGKSSLIQCGLANKFEESDWLPVNIRRGTNIVESLVSSLSKVSLTSLSISSIDDKTIKPEAIVEAIQSLYLDHF
ncbi:MAG: ATP-binding protein, partial [Candidatus Aerophobus sp.]